MAKYNISKVRQLIDLNGETVNFEANFKVVCDSKEPFEILVVSQTDLDSNPNIEYKKVYGEISGQIRYDKNVYQNHYIILKSENPCVCTVHIDKKELPKTEEKKVIIEKPEKEKEAGINWMKILFFAGVVIAVGFALYYFSRKKPEEEDKFKFSEQPLQTPVRNPKQNKLVFDKSASNESLPVNKSLLHRLKNLNLS